MRAYPIRIRLTALYAAVLLFGLALFGSVLWLAARQGLLAGLDKRLAQRADGLRIVLEGENNSTPTAELEEELTEYARAVPEGSLLRIQDGSGRDLIADPALPEIPQNTRGFGNASIGNRRYRTLTELITVRGKTYQVWAAASLRELDDLMGELRVLLLIAIPFVLLAASAGGYWLSRRALSPVDEITGAARSIGPENLSTRLPVPRTGDELQRLSETWNEMLERLDSAVDRIQRFTADASHELRTPVSVIRTTAELALRRERNPEQYRDALHQILLETERMTQLTEDLLLLARGDAREFTLRWEPVDWNEVAGRVVEEGRSIAEARGIRLRIDPAPGAVMTLGDESALRRLLTVLLDNALKHTPAGGSIEVAISSAEQLVIVTVRDSGEGIDPTDLPHIFDRFYRGDKARNRQTGVGLGLAIAQSAANMHGARIEVESELGRGATFTASFAKLPADEYQEEAGRSASTSRRIAANNSEVSENR